MGILLSIARKNPVLPDADVAIAADRQAVKMHNAEERGLWYNMLLKEILWRMRQTWFRVFAGRLFW